METSVNIGGGLLARNAALNFVGQAIPFVIGLVTIPVIVRGLGADGFGVLSIAWLIVGYAGIFDLGLGRATTKFVAECLGGGTLDELPGLVWTSLGFQLLFGVGGGVLLGGLAPILVHKVLKVPPHLMAETAHTFFILAASLPVLFALNTLRGVLEARQRFDLVNYVKVPASVSAFVLPVIALSFGQRLPGIVLLLVISRVGAMLAYLVLCFKIFPVLVRRFSFDVSLFRRLVTYGGWLTVSALVAPVLVNMERFLIGSLLSVAALGYYTAPYEAITRLWIFPVSLTATLFPAFSSMDASGARRRELSRLYARSVNSLLLAMGPLTALAVAFAPQILRLWLGSDFAEQSAWVLRLLAMGVLINSVAYVPFSLLQGLGRPDLTAKFHFLELPFHAALLWFLVGRMGITGAALAWTLRVGFDGALLFGSAWWLGLVPSRAFAENGLMKSILGVSGFAVALSLTSLIATALPTQAVLAALLVLLFAVGAWSFILDSGEKAFLTFAASQVFTTFRRAHDVR